MNIIYTIKYLLFCLLLALNLDCKSKTVDNSKLSNSHNKIVYLEQDAPRSGFTSGYNKVSLVDLSTGEHIYLTNDKYMTLSANFSSDGKNILIGSAREGSEEMLAQGMSAGFNIYKISIADGKLEKYSNPLPFTAHGENILDTRTGNLYFSSLNEIYKVSNKDYHASVVALLDKGWNIDKMYHNDLDSTFISLYSILSSDLISDSTGVLISDINKHSGEIIYTSWNQAPMHKLMLSGHIKGKVYFLDQKKLFSCETKLGGKVTFVDSLAIDAGKISECEMIDTSKMLMIYWSGKDFNYDIYEYDLNTKNMKRITFTNNLKTCLRLFNKND